MYICTINYTFLYMMVSAGEDKSRERADSHCSGPRTEDVQLHRVAG